MIDYLRRFSEEHEGHAANSAPLVTTAAQSAPPLRIEPKEWKAIERLLIEFDRTNFDFRSAWS